MTIAFGAGGGYDYNFVTPPPDRLVCKICILPCCEPEMTVCCGYNFCKSDVEKLRKSTSVSKACPTCRNPSFHTYVNKQADREIKELQVYCPNKSAGCEWVGEVKDVRKHRKNDKGCLFEKIKCPNNCESELQRQDIPSHIEADCSCYCQYCRISADKETISAQHKENCPKFPKPCPNRCGETSIPHEDLDKHRKRCLEEPVECFFQDMGCTVRAPRKNREEHSSKNLEKHLELTKQGLSKRSNDLAKVTATLATKRELERLRQELVQAKMAVEEMKKELIAVKQEGKNELAMEVNKLATNLRAVQKEIDDSKKSIADNSTKIAAVETQCNQEINGVKVSIENDIQRGKAIFTINNFIWFGLFFVAVVAIDVCKPKSWSATND